jgi:hypothetical protein
VVVAIDQYAEVALGPDGRAWACWERWGPWPENPDIDIWFAQGLIYSPTSIPESATVQPPLRMLQSVPNPARGWTSIIFAVRESGTYRATIADAAGRIVDRVALDWLEPGIHSGERALRWPLGRDVDAKSGVYFIKFEDVRTRRSVTSGKFVLVK